MHFQTIHLSYHHLSLLLLMSEYFFSSLDYISGHCALQMHPQLPCKPQKYPIIDHLHELSAPFQQYQFRPAIMFYLPRTTSLFFHVQG